MQPEVAADQSRCLSKSWTSRYTKTSEIGSHTQKHISILINVFFFRYIYFYEKGSPHITPSDIQSLIELINTEMQSDNNGNTRTHSDPFFTSTLRYMRFQKQKGGLMGDKYELIKLWLVSSSLQIKSIDLNLLLFFMEVQKKWLSTLKSMCTHLVYFLVSFATNTLSLLCIESSFSICLCLNVNVVSILWSKTHEIPVAKNKNALRND